MRPQTAARIHGLREATKPFGVFTAADAAKHGISRSLLRRYVQNGPLLRNVFDRGVYRFNTPAENESIVDAALMAGPEAVASHVTALRLHNLTDLLPDADEFTLPRSRRSRRPPAPLKFHFTSTPLLDADITSVLGVRVTTPARSLIDVTRPTGRLDQIERGIAEAMERGLATRADFVAAVERSNLTRNRRDWFLDAVEAAAALIQEIPHHALPDSRGREPR
jgi:predicted transcriptional regulator of viral defense system